jgi:hypothetical protein
MDINNNSDNRFIWRKLTGLRDFTLLVIILILLIQFTNKKGENSM